MKRLFAIVLTLVLLLTSCDIAQSARREKADVHFLSLALKYEGGMKLGEKSWASELRGTLTDQRMLDEEFEHLALVSGTDYESILITNGDGGVNTIDRNGNIEVIKPEDFVSQFEAVLEDFAESLGEDDILIFHYSGHGAEGGDPVLPSGDGLATLYPLERLTGLFDRIGAKKFLILDSCYSGSIVPQDEKDPRKDFAGLMEKYDLPDSDTWYSAASQSYEPSYTVEVDGLDIGNHTLRILEALGYDFDAMRPAWNGRRLVTVNSILSSLSERGYQYQHPDGSLGTKDLVLFRF